jgi:hypothetical protein
MYEREYLPNTKQNDAIGDFWIRKTVNSPFSAPSSHKVRFWRGIEDRGGRKSAAFLRLTSSISDLNQDSSPIISKLIDSNSVDSLPGQSVTGRKSYTGF